MLIRAFAQISMSRILACARMPRPGDLNCLTRLIPAYAGIATDYVFIQAGNVKASKPHGDLDE
jgi:hypothetical protein